MRVKRGYLYVANLDPRFGSEAGKRRPVVVIQTELLNEIEHPSTWVLPCTTQLISETNMLRVHLPKGSAGNAQNCDVMIDQSRAIDHSRFKKELGIIPKPLFNEIIEKLKLVGGLN